MTILTPEMIAKLPYRPCVGIFLVNADGLVFVGERLDTPDAWQMPQGGVDRGEDAREAALRELKEETGIEPADITIEAETPEWIPYDLPIERVPSLWKGRYRGQEQKWFLMRFNGEDGLVDISGPPPEFARWRWLPADQLLDTIVPFKRGVYARVLSSFDGKF